MSKTEVITEIENLPAKEQEEIFALLVRKIMTERDSNPKPWLEKTLTFDEACDVVFRENRELFSLLAK